MNKAWPGRFHHPPLLSLRGFDGGESFHLLPWSLKGVLKTSVEFFCLLGFVSIHMDPNNPKNHSNKVVKKYFLDEYFSIAHNIVLTLLEPGQGGFSRKG